MGTWVKAGKSSQFADGDVRGVDLDDTPVAIYCVAGELYATSNVCTHAFALLSDGFLDDCTIECPLHAGRFDVRTGRALGHPVTVSIRTYPVKRDGDDVLVELD
jgi:nitrite reductase/ring-hydroxylating ferredoxin subunit